MSRPSSTQKAELQLGGEPRVDLLPAEVRLARRGAKTRGRLVGLLVVCVLVVVCGYAYASIQASTAQSRLVAEQARTTSSPTASHPTMALCSDLSQGARSESV